MIKHIAVFKDSGAEDILLGKKTVEIRFSKKKTPPYGVVSSGDLVYIKPTGKDIIGQFRVKKVIFIDKPELSDLRSLGILSNFEYKDSKYATIIYIGESSRFITSPIKLSKKIRGGWVILG